MSYVSAIKEKYPRVWETKILERLLELQEMDIGDPEWEETCSEYNALLDWVSAAVVAYAKEEAR